MQHGRNRRQILNFFKVLDQLTFLNYHISKLSITCPKKGDLHSFPKLGNSLLIVNKALDYKHQIACLKCNSQDDYLLAPNEANRDNMMHVVSRAFSHYWSKVSERELRFHDLRNTYATEMIRRYGPDMGTILGGLHSDASVTIKHYLNKKEILKEKRGTKLFG